MLAVIADSSDTLSNAMTDINSNQVHKTSDYYSCIDLISNSSTDKPITIEGDTHAGTPISPDYSDISSKELQSSDLKSTHSSQCILVESSEEGEIQDKNEIIQVKEEVTKIKKYKRKRPSRAADDSRLSDETKTHKVQRIVISINTNVEQDTPHSKSSIQYTTHTHTTEETIMKTKEKKKRRKKKKSTISSLNDVTMEKILPKHCKCCKCKKTNGSHKTNNPNESNRSVTIATVSNSEHYLRQSLLVTADVSTDYPAKDKTPFKNIKADRPLPECRRDCRRSRRDYVPKYVKYCGKTMTESEHISSDKLILSERKSDSPFSLSDLESLISHSRKNKADLEHISSDELSLSENKLDSSCSLSDIESLITRARKREKNPTNSSVKQIEKLTVQISDDSEQNYTDKSCVTNKKESSKMDDCGVMNEDAPKQTSFGKLRLVPIEKLLDPNNVVNKHFIEAPLQTVKKNCVDAITNNKSKDKPVGTVIPFRHDKNTTANAAKTSNTNPHLNSKFRKVSAKEIEVNVGSILNDQYETCEMIKKGSFSHVVKAIDKQKNIKVVLKILHVGKYSHTLYNLKLLNGLDPLDTFHCVRLVDQFFVKGHLALCLEDCSCNLGQRLERMGSGTAFPLTVLQRLSTQLLIAVQFMRECSLQHANIRPEHILLNSNDTNLKLTGFDGAIAPNASIQKGYDWQPLRYRAPEIILKLKTSYSVDVWSAACVIYEMATGNTLFSGNENAILMQIMDLNKHFPEHMSVGEHFVNKKFHRKCFNPRTGKEESAPVKLCKTKRNLQMELLQAYQQSCKASGVQQVNEEQIKLTKALSMALHSMLLVDPNRRITVDFALLNIFFLVMP